MHNEWVASEYWILKNGFAESAIHIQRKYTILKSVAFRTSQRTVRFHGIPSLQWMCSRRSHISQRNTRHSKEKKIRHAKKFLVYKNRRSKTSIYANWPWFQYSVISCDLNDRKKTVCVECASFWRARFLTLIQQRGGVSTSYINQLKENVRLKKRIYKQIFNRNINRLFTHQREKNCWLFCIRLRKFQRLI